MNNQAREMTHGGDDEIALSYRKTTLATAKSKKSHGWPGLIRLHGFYID